MDEYVIGSVADLISNKSTAKVKNKKSKLKNSENQSGIIKTLSDTTSSDVSKEKVKKKAKDASKNTLVESFSPSGQDFENDRKSSETESLLVKKKSQAKKRKKSNTVDEEDILNHKKPKNDLFYDHLPSDSEEEDQENAGKNSRGGEKFSKKDTKTKPSNENTVFVGNIPINYDKQKICKVFSKFGEIQNARIRCIPIGDINMSKKVAAIKKKFNPKRNSLVAYVNFKLLDSAKAAVEANGMVIDGHHLRVDFAESSKERDNNKAVFVGGLPFHIEDDELWEFFQNCGPICSVRIIRDSQTSMGKGFGYVNFESTAAVELALQMNGQELRKRAINVKRCINARNKNKLNAFGRQKSKEMANQFLCKRGKKYKEEKKKLKKEKKFSNDFQGRTANMKQKKKKKLSKAALRQRKLVKVLGAS